MRYSRVIATGGIGTGMLFLTDVMETLGRSESRLVTLSPAKDYCKQHIVLHYTAALSKDRYQVYPIGYVGCDATGDSLLQDMVSVGMDVSYVGRSETLPTMISVCLQYPDREGCNFTAVNNATELVTPEYIETSLKQLDVGPDCIVAAIPEVSIESRATLLRFGKSRGAYCVLSVPAAEATAFLKTDAFSNCDLLAVNEEEARALCCSSQSGKELSETLYDKMKEYHRGISVLVTFGGRGACTVTENGSEVIPVLHVPVINTTGAGDACLGGTIAGIATGMPLQKGTNDPTFGKSRLASAVELGTICASMAVMSVDSIAWDVNCESIKKRLDLEGWSIDYEL